MMKVWTPLWKRILWTPSWMHKQSEYPAELIVLDIDNCVIQPSLNAPLSYHKALAELGKIAILSKSGKLPPICMNTGRDRNYVEAVAFLTGISGWCVIQGGGWIFNPITKELERNPEITEESFLALLKLEHEWVPKITKEYPEFFHYPGKTGYVTLEVHEHNARMSIDHYYARIKEDKDVQCLEGRGLIEVTRSQIAVDIGPTGKNGSINKGSGMRLLAQKTGVHPKKMLVIGDSSSDRSMFELGGFVACPSNATPEIIRFTRELGGYVSPFAYAEGVVDGIKHCVGARKS